MNIAFDVCVTKCALEEHQDAIVDLFQRSYGQTLSCDFWRWAYLDNPCGEPIVSLAWSGTLLVGHYAVVPLRYVRSGVPVQCVLSMTTMTAPEARGKGVFTQQAQQVYALAETQGYALVLGFPNANSLPGFQKHLGWSLDQEDYIACVRKDRLLANAPFRRSILDDTAITLNLEDVVLRNWRLAKPGMNYEARGATIVKPFGQYTDIVYCGVDVADALYDEEQYCILLDGKIDEFKEVAMNAYPSGYRVFGGDISRVMLKKDLLLSDVF